MSNNYDNIDCANCPEPGRYHKDNMDAAGGPYGRCQYGISQARKRHGMASVLNPHTEEESDSYECSCSGFVPAG